MKTFLLSVAAFVVFQNGLAAPSSSYKLGHSLQQELQSNNYVDVIVSLREKTSTVFRPVMLQSFKTRTDRLNTVASSLKQLAAASQKLVLEFLSTYPDVIVKSFWISNQIVVKGASVELINQLASRDEISNIILNEEIPLDKPINAHPASRPADSGRANQWGIENIQAPEAWAEGVTGQGVVIATVDTGCLPTHESLRSNYRGGDYSWYDPYMFTQEPNDQNGHGTHTTANIAGTNGVGVAPGAKWMSCKGCATSACAMDALLGCGQYCMCPTKFDGTEAPDCSNAPQVVSNSWGAGRFNDFYNEVIEAYHAVHIIPVFSIGNTGPSCSTARSPGEQYVIGVGATTSANELAYFSSIGPSMYGDHDLKPNVAAPGNNVLSAYHTSDTAYYTMSGTSMACPHTAGTIALLLAINPNLKFEEVKEFLYAGADHNVVPTGQTCGGIKDDGQSWPNNAFGYGKINALNSVKAVLKAYRN